MKTNVTPLHYLIKGSHLDKDNIHNKLNLQNIEINYKEKIILELNGV